MPTTITTNTSDQDSTPNLAGKAFNIFSYVASAVVGAKVARTQLHDSVYQKYKEDPDFFVNEARAARTKHKQDEMEVLAKERGVSKYLGACGKKEIFPDMPGIPKLLEKVQLKFDADLDAKFKENGFSNMHDFWIALDPTKKDNVMEKGFAFAAITLGALLTIANSKSMTRFLTRRQDEDRSQSR